MQKNKMTAVEYLEYMWTLQGAIYKGDIDKALEMEKEQKGYSEEDVRKAYQQGEEDSYLKGGQTKEMENEFIQSLKQTKQDDKTN